jgi:catechol 2,3-dioxygenase-like lactoylglutathione lyase family enzyme
MITALDHIAIAVHEIDAAQALYTRLLGVEPDRQDDNGARRAWFRFPNTALELMAPDGVGAAGDRVRAQLEVKGEGLWSLAFATSDLVACQTLLARRGLGGEILSPPAQALSLEPRDTGGLQIFMKPQAPVRISPARSEGAIVGLDHVVVHTANVDRALAVYGAKLGLDLRLDRANESWGVRQLFFRAGDAVVEFGASLKAATSDKPDEFGGLSWRVADAAAARDRLEPMSLRFATALAAFRPS